MHPPRLLRAVLGAVLLASAPLPAFAAPSDVALLQTYAGNWKGNGKLSGAEDGTVACRLTFKPRGEQLTYTGRCNLAGAGNSSFSGILSYNQASKRFEAASSATGVVVGKKSGGGIVFTMQDRNPRGQVNSTLSLGSGSIRVDFRIVDANTRAVTSARIPFTKS